MTPQDIRNHPANAGLDFSFDGSISKEVLCNYLSRSMTLSGVLDEESLRMILNTGVKLIGRAGGYWRVTAEDMNRLDGVRAFIEQAHAIDPELLFEACIFEMITGEVDKIPIPAWAFEEFGLTPEERCFDWTRIRFPNRQFLNTFGEGSGIPDITRQETQLFFYYLARTYIDAGFEVLHMGQVHWIGEHDEGFVCYTRLNDRIRSYAKKHARRHFVMINAHSHGIIDANGRLMFDFHEYPMRGKVPEGSVPHRPTEDNPQIIEFEVGYTDAIYQKSLGGITYSGWSCDSLPYTVELDNYPHDDAAKRHQPVSHWGFDEIGWFANQPRSYRRKWLRYAYNWVHHTDPAGYLMMPGSRICRVFDENDELVSYNYYNFPTARCKVNFNDEPAIREIFVQSRNPSA